MRSQLALKRYLDRYIEHDLPLPSPGTHWLQVIVIPLYDESPALLEELAKWNCPPGTLAILVLNRPDTSNDTQCNDPIRHAVDQLPRRDTHDRPMARLSDTLDLYLHDLEKLRGPTPAGEGVGLARKVGCDIACYWQELGHIHSEWICSTDADATLPPDYFVRLAKVPSECAAATFPFRHGDSQSKQEVLATRLYELRLHHYVLGLEYANSPYAYHTLGSCLAIRCASYASVRGFPKRAGGEDFYLLNKAVKTGRIHQLSGDCIELQSRVSGRVPFGTGPAVDKILNQGEWSSHALFYHPQCYQALAVVLEAIGQIAAAQVTDLQETLNASALSAPLARASLEVLETMGIQGALTHCHKQSRSEAQFLRQFHHWFDGFRTLKFIHGVRESGWPQQSLADLTTFSPQLWPAITHEATNMQALRLACEKHWAWTSRPA